MTGCSHEEVDANKNESAYFFTTPIFTFRAYIEFERPPGLDRRTNAILPAVYRAIKMR